MKKMKLFIQLTKKQLDNFTDEFHLKIECSLMIIYVVFFSF